MTKVIGSRWATWAALLTTARRAALLTTGLGLAGLSLAACGSDDASGAAALVDQGAFVVVANSPGTISTNGPQRILVAILGDGPNDSRGGPDLPAVIEFRSEDGSVTDTEPSEWLSATGATLGLYVTQYTFPFDGVWEVGLAGSEESLSSINVAAESAIPDRGDPAPPSLTPTATDPATLAEITTDPDPDPAFYELSVADAVASGRPTVVVFATPAFCQTALCGPTIDIVKGAVAQRPEIQVVHVEPYDISLARTGNLQPIDAMADWGLQTEPWVFLIDADGNVAASFEGIIGSDELLAAIDQLG